MGGGSYSFTSRSARIVDSGAMHKSVHENFEKYLQKEMSPLNVMREARDSEEHPNTVPFIVGLDVTGSMGRVPQMFLLEGLPTLMNEVFTAGVKDPQLCFIAIGDIKCDRAPLQVGQFESSDELVDKWLTKVWPEGGGGGNGGESYSLAYVFAAHQTVTDSWQKRKQKGFLFTVGDENVHKVIDKNDLKDLTGLGDIDTDVNALLAKAQETYHVFHIHLTETSGGSSSKVQGVWKELLGDNCIICHDYKTIPDIIGKKIIEVLGTKVSAVNGSPIKQPDKPYSSESAEPVVY